MADTSASVVSAVTFSSLKTVVFLKALDFRLCLVVKLCLSPRLRRNRFQLESLMPALTISTWLEVVVFIELLLTKMPLAYCNLQGSIMRV